VPFVFMPDRQKPPFLSELQGLTVPPLQTRLHSRPAYPNWQEHSPEPDLPKLQMPCP